MANNSRGADLLVRAAEVAGIERFFALSGNQIMPIFDACLESGVEMVHTRHEAAAVHMADAWGRLTGRPGVALVTAGPGFANTLSALYVALAAESPLVLLGGHSPLAAAGRGAFQEMAQAEMAGHVTKASWTAADAANLGHDLARAVRLAHSGRPGPVHLALPVDLLEANVGNVVKSLPQPEDFQPVVGLLDMQMGREILAAVENTKRPLILAGPSLTNRPASDRLEKLEDALGVPVIGMESPRGINDPSLGAFAEVLAEADLLVLIGKGLNFTLRFGEPPVVAPDCRLIQIDPEMRIIERTMKVLGKQQSARLILTDPADPGATVERLIQLAEESKAESDRGWLDEVRSSIAYRPAEWQTLSASAPGRLHPVEICRGVQEFLRADEDAVLVCDGGEFGQWVQACVAAPHRIINGPSGSIGSSLPFALSARLAFPESRVVTCLGDGTFGFHPAEFDTAVRGQLPFVAVVGNDAAWNAEKQIQINQYGPERVFGCDLRPTRYDDLARSLGGYGEQVTAADDLPAALDRALAANQPACVNVALGATAAPVIRRN